MTLADNWMGTLKFRPGQQLWAEDIHEHQVVIMACYSGTGGREWIYRAYCHECKWTAKLRTVGDSEVEVLDIPNPVV